MKPKNLPFLLLPLLFLSCSTKQKTITKIQQKNIITIDTTISKIVSGEEFTTITTKLNSIIRLKKTNISKDGEKIGKMIEYFDSSGIRVKQISENYLLENSYPKTYIWYESTTYKIIMKIDSLFNRKSRRLSNVDIIFGSGEVLASNESTNISKSYTLTGKVFLTFIIPKNSNYTYIENNNDFYMVRNDIPSKYMERIPSSKTEFGLAYKTVIEAERLAKLKIKEPTIK